MRPRKLVQRFGACLCAFSLFASFSATALADAKLANGGMNLHLFRPAVDSRGHFSVNGTDVVPHKAYSFGLLMDAGFHILDFHGFKNDSATLAADAEREQEIVKTAFTGYLHFNFGLFDWAELGLQLPIVFFNGASLESPGQYNVTPNTRALNKQGVGDLSFHAKVRLGNAARHHIGGAAILRVSVPTGSEKQFTGEPGASVWPSLVLEYRPIQKVRFSLEGGYRVITGDGATFRVNGRTTPGAATATAATFADNSGTDITYDDLITFGFGASFRLTRVVDLVMELYGTDIAKEMGSREALSMEAMGGLKLFVLDHSFLTIGAGAGIPKKGFQAADVRGMVGFVFEPVIRDRDGDGIKDDVDRCPDNPEDKDGFKDADGCPDPDNDGDGILDKDDRCPLIKENYNGILDEDGCPENEKGDRDGDGIPDDRDKCPDDPEDFDGFEDQDGCPDLDNDRDGIPDTQDLCPNEPEDKDGFQDEDGCPDNDNDNDRIPDVRDACPDKPETYNGYKDEDGCPDEGKVIIEGDQIRILEKIYFETDSAVILPRSFALLDAVAATLKGNPQLTLVEVQGHADERGADKYNIDLTRARAASVVDALIDRGVNPSRLRSAGYGERCPVDDKHTPTAWEKNRRVEFKIIATDAGPTGVEVACPAGRSLAPK